MNPPGKTPTSSAPKRLARRWSRWLSLLPRLLLPAMVVAAALAIQLQDPQFRARMRQNAFDQLQAMRPAPYHDELPLRVIAIDDASLKSVGQWPWPRTVLAGMTDRLFELGARVVVFDIFMIEPDRTSPEQIAASWPENKPLRDLLEKLPSHDRVLAESFTRGKVVLSFPVEPAETAAPLPVGKVRFLSFGGDARDWLPRYGGAAGSLPLLVNAATGNAAVSLAPDSDGVVRAMPLLCLVGDTLYPILGLEALRQFLDIDKLSLQASAPDASRMGQAVGIQGVGLDTAFVPTTPDGRLWLHFRPLAPQRYIPAQDLLAGKVDAARIKDHIVFLGATAKGLGDTVYSPLGEAIPGVEGHVQMIEQIMSGEFLLQAAWENDLVSGVLLAEWLLLALLLARFRPVWSVLAACVTVAGLFALSWWLFVERQLLLDPLYPALAVSALFLSLVVPRYLSTEREQRWIRNAFSRYVSPNRVKFLQEHPEHLELGSAYRECSFVMTDLEGFTSLMERHEPAKLSDLLNEYLNGMICIAFSHDGTLDRIVGDAVAVMFSAPLVQPDHAARALACALEMDAFAQDFSLRQRELGIPFGRTRIGVNSGTVLVGNFGGKVMLDYRALGDAINTAARLETINAQLGTRISISGASVAQCAGFTGRPAGRLVLKGKRDAVAVYEPLSAEEADSPRVREYMETYALMENEASEAAAAFRALAQKYPDDPLAAYHAGRLAAGESGSLVVMSRK